MNTRSIAFLLTVVGICIGTSQLQADEPAQSDQVTQDVCEPVAGDECGADRTDLEAWMICEEWMAYEAAIAIDEVIEPAVANENELQEVDGPLADESDGIVCADEAVESDGIPVAEETADEFLQSEAVVSEETVQVDVEAVLVFEEAVTEVAETTEETFAETIKDRDLIQEFKCVEGFDGWIVERDFEAEGLTEEKDESLESEAVVGEETVQVDADDAVQIFEEAATDESETTEEEIFANEELTGGSSSIAVFDANCDDVGFAADESSQEETTVEETVEAIESAEVEGNVENIGLAVEEAISNDTAGNVETEEREGSSLESAEPDLAREQAVEEGTTTEEAVDATDTDEDVASPVVVETLDEESSLQEAIEEPQDAAVEPSTANEGDNVEEQVSENADIDADEVATIDATDSVVEIDETLEVAEPQVEELELQESANESTTADDINESDTVIVRTIELGGCKIIIQSARQMDEFELLNMLWEAVDQLEAEMD